MIEDEDIQKIQKKMEECLTNLRKLVPRVAEARQAKKFILDQRKTLLAKYQSDYLAKGESVAASTIMARGNPSYAAENKHLEEAYKEAEVSIVEWEYNQTKLESCRSMLAMARTTLGL
jgi:hypothetical protein